MHGQGFELKTIAAHHRSGYETGKVSGKACQEAN
jgi:hypothetical protein